jgi:glycogen synthase
MKLLMTTDTVGGVWSYTVQLCRALVRYGVEIDVAAMGGALSDAQRRDVRGLAGVVVHEGGYGLEWMDDPWRDVAAAGAWLCDIADRVQPDLVHLNGYAHAALPWRRPVLVVAHSCVLSWWRAVHGAAAPPEWDRYRRVVGTGIAAADLVVAPTAAMLDAIAACYGAPVRTAVIPNGVDQDRLPFGHRDAFGRYRVPARHADLVLAAGRLWDPAKDVATLATAAALIEWPVCIAGPDTAPDGSRVRPRGVRHLGVLPRPALDQWYRRASIFVHPAVYEPFGLAPLEAALGGCALVLADIPSLREVWGDAATYVTPRNPVALADAVNRLAADAGERASRARAATVRARAFTAGRMAREYLARYRQLSGIRATSRKVLACAS